MESSNPNKEVIQAESNESAHQIYDELETWSEKDDTQQEDDADATKEDSQISEENTPSLHDYLESTMKSYNGDQENYQMIHQSIYQNHDFIMDKSPEALKLIFDKEDYKKFIGVINIGKCLFEIDIAYADQVKTSYWVPTLIHMVKQNENLCHKIYALLCINNFVYQGPEYAKYLVKKGAVPIIIGCLYSNLNILVSNAWITLGTFAVRYDSFWTLINE